MRWRTRLRGSQGAIAGCWLLEEGGREEWGGEGEEVEGNEEHFVEGAECEEDVLQHVS